MLIIPAIDIRHGSCVRLVQGDPAQETVYSDDPLRMAHLWRDKGAEMLHLVDLDGAFEGKPIHLPLLGLIRKEVKIPVEAGGGFRDMDAIQQAFDHGIDRVILGTVAIHKPDLVREAVESFGDMISVSIDVSGSFATAAGWKEISAIPYSDLANRMRDLGVEELLFTDTKRDGTLLGPDLGAIQKFLEAAGMPVTISGGIKGVEDIKALRPFESMGLKAVVIGKALYDQRLQLEDALRAAS